MVDYSREPADREVAERLRIALAKQGMTNAKFAEAVGVSEQAVGKWLKTGEIARQRLPSIATTLNITLDWLLMGVGPMHPQKPLNKKAAELVRNFDELQDEDWTVLWATATALRKNRTGDPVEVY